MKEIFIGTASFYFMYLHKTSNNQEITVNQFLLCLHKYRILVVLHRLIGCILLFYRNGGDWATDGCETKFRNGSVTDCRCNHLTNFAVLLSLKEIVNNFSFALISIFQIKLCHTLHAYRVHILVVLLQMYIIVFKDRVHLLFHHLS